MDIPTALLEWPATTAGLLSQALYDQCKPEIDIRENDIVIAWEDWRDYLEDDGGGIIMTANIYGHSLDVTDPSQYRWPGNGQPITLAKHDQLQPQVSGNVIVFGDERRKPIAAYQLDQRMDANIYAQQLGGECDLPTEMHWKEEFVKWTWGTEIQEHCFVVDSLGNTYAVWIEMRPDQGGAESVFAQKLDMDGVPKWYNDGVMVSTPGNTCLHPDICVDANEGAYVTWQQDGDDIYLAHLNYLGTITGTVMDADPGDAPKVVEDDGGGVYLAFTETNAGVQLRQYDAALTLQRSATHATPQAPFMNVQLSKDREGGIWFAWYDGTEIYGSRWSTGPIPISEDNLAGIYGLIQWDAIKPEFDLDTDYNALDRIWHTANRYDGLITATAIPLAGPGAPYDIVVARLRDMGGVAKFYGGRNVSTNGIRGSGNDGYRAAIAADSMAVDFSVPPNKQLGGAIISWTNRYFDSRVQDDRFQVLTQRVVWEEVPAPVYLQGVLFFTPLQEPILDRELTDEPVSDIAAVFNPDQEYLPDVPRYGVVTWNSDRSLGCTDPMAVRVQYIDYSDYYSPLFWTPYGRDVAPLLGMNHQDGPMVKPPWPESAVAMPNSAQVYWSDNRPGTSCLLATRIHDENRTLVWNKDVARDIEVPRPESVALGAPYPNPASLQRHGTVQLPVTMQEEAAVRLTLYDAVGRAVYTAENVRLPAGEHVLPVELSRLGDVPPGVYYFGIESASGLKTKQWILLR